MATDKDKTILARGLDSLGEVKHFRNVGEIVEGQTNGVRTEVLEFADEIRLFEDLQVQQSDLMASGDGGGGDALDAERFEPQVDFAVH